MGSSKDRLFNRETTIHELFGGGLVADVTLWRRKNLSFRILMSALATWVVLELSGHTLISFVSSVFFLLFTILFLWAKSAAFANRPAPPLPRLHISEEMVNEAATSFRENVNHVLSICEDIALGRDSRMFTKVALCLSIFSIIGRLANFITFCCTSIIVFLVAPVLYERYEDHIERCVLIGHKRIKKLCVRLGEKQKLS